MRNEIGSPQGRQVPVRHMPEGQQVESTDLLGGSRELLIRHRGQTYRLRQTGAGKLILVK